MNDLPRTARTYGDQVRARRHARGLSLAELGDLAGVTRSYICHIEHGRRTPGREVAEAIAQALYDSPAPAG